LLVGPTINYSYAAGLQNHNFTTSCMEESLKSIPCFKYSFFSNGNHKIQHSMQQINMFESAAEIKCRIKLLAQQLEAGISRRNIRLDKTDHFNL